MGETFIAGGYFTSAVIPAEAGFYHLDDSATTIDVSFAAEFYRSIPRIFKE